MEKKHTKSQMDKDNYEKTPHLDVRVQQSMQDSEFEPQEEDFLVESIMHSPPPDFDEEPMVQAMPHSAPSIQAAPHSVPNGDIVSTDPWRDAWNEITNIQSAADIMINSKSVIIFSGAGISIPSITFDDLPALTHKTKIAIRDRNYYEYLKTQGGDNLRDSYLFGSILKILQGKPNLGHQSVAILNKYFEILGKKFNIITQNLDYLHELAVNDLVEDQKADLSNIEHIHGWLKTSTCPKCSKIHDYSVVLSKFQNDPVNNEFMLCGTHTGKKCDGVLTPDMIEYGEQVVDYDSCAKTAKKSDLILVLGTSLRVTPANRLIDIVHKNKGKVILFNRSNTPKDPMADIHIRSNLDCTLPILVNIIKKDIQSNYRKKKKILLRIDKIKIFNVETTKS